MGDDPDFYLSGAGEMRGQLAIPHACWEKGRLSDKTRITYMLIKIDPPVIGQEYGLGDKDISQLIISPRFQGSSLFPVSEWPCHVYITRILDETILKTMTFGRGQVEMIGWGTIFHTLDEATAYAARY